MTDRMGCAQVEVGLIFLAVLVAQQLHPFPVLHGDHAPLCDAALDSGDDVILLPSKKGSRAAAHEFMHVRTGKHGCMAALAACAHLVRMVLSTLLPVFVSTTWAVFTAQTQRMLARHIQCSSSCEEWQFV